MKKALPILAVILMPLIYVIEIKIIEMFQLSKEDCNMICIALLISCISLLLICIFYAIISFTEGND